MVIWRGWGVLAFIYAALAMIFCLGAASTVVPGSALPFTAAIGLLLAAVATWFTGRALNVTGPQKKIDAWFPARQQQVHELVDTGRFSLGPGQPPPTSHEEARDQGEQLLQLELQQARRSLNIHTLFFVPMQYWAVIMACVAVLVVVLGAVGLVAG